MIGASYYKSRTFSNKGKYKLTYFKCTKKEELKLSGFLKCSRKGSLKADFVISLITSSTFGTGLLHSSLE